LKDYLGEYDNKIALFVQENDLYEKTKYCSLQISDGVLLKPQYYKNESDMFKYFEKQCEFIVQNLRIKI
jgi:hypothetical protein